MICKRWTVAIMLIGEKIRCRPLGFTLIELVVVLVIVSLMATLAVPVVSTSIHRANEAALRETLMVTRKALDDYYADNGTYPDSLEDLVSKRYLRTHPTDPVAGDSVSWELVRSDSFGSYGIMDIKSSSNRQARDGTYFNDW